MVGRAESLIKKRQNHIEIQEKWIRCAALLYKAEQEKQGTEEKKGLRTVCKEMVERCWQEDQERITVDKQTVSQRLAGIQSQAQSNAERNEALNAEESKSLISYAVNIAQRGFPLTPH
ncbi:hypothetical protein EV421DRAFT_1721352 [Armillaria borealis]|uniref:Uncharacterized protein n=1 Tax=Armillaria borealis TaxID=47425 RepID=A0AA39MD98_9AGAR|nr:hypothetical protein EV421DRAFT_1721352 [Armillaria borealis]